MTLHRIKKAIATAFPFVRRFSRHVPRRADNSPYAALLEKVPGFRNRLDSIKAASTFDDSTLFWHPYDILSNFNEIGEMLTFNNRDLLSLARSGPVADLGAADGDLAFFLESCGVDNVHIIEYGPTSCNRMKGVRLLKSALSSSVTIHELNLDSFFEMPPVRWGLVFLLGTLYHLKNPFSILEALARNADFCILSTRVMRFSPDQRTALSHLPVAYLLDEKECNNDVTNYWVFSDAGLRRIIARAGWEIIDYGIFGSGNATPDSMTEMARAFCLLRSVGQGRL